MKEFEKLNFYRKGFSFRIIHQEKELHHFFNEYYEFQRFQDMFYDIIVNFGLSCLLNQSIIFHDMEFEVTKFMFSQGNQITIFIK